MLRVYLKDIEVLLKIVQFQEYREKFIQEMKNEFPEIEVKDFFGWIGVDVPKNQNRSIMIQAFEKKFNCILRRIYT